MIVLLLSVVLLCSVVLLQAGARYTFDILVEYTEDPVGTISDAICR